ncbi:MAG: asparagine synthase-related protein [Bacteroidales bacterium]|nr:asparagine synthase-related protein [Bacteroidales bacterium]
MTTLNGDFSSGIITGGQDWSTSISPEISFYFFGSLFLSEITENPCKDPAGHIAGLYAKTGLDCLRKLDGTYLLVIKDGKSIYVVRDRFGSGQQVYFNQKGFSTSLEDILKLTNTKPEPNWDTLSGFLQFGYIPAPGTGIKGINKLPSGVLLKWNGIEVSTSELYSFEDYHNVDQNAKMTLNDAVEQYKFLHQQAIKKRIAGATNVGVLLSGGYDSAGNIAALHEIYNGKVQAFSIGFKDNPWSEIPLAKQMADKIGAEFHQYEIDGSELNEIPELIKQLGDPFQEGGLMVNFAAMRLAAGFNPDVVLGGDGNDQHHGTFAKELAMNHLIRSSGMGFLQKGLYNYTRKQTSYQDDNLFRYGFHNRKILNILYMDAFGFSDGELGAIGLKDVKLSNYGVPDSIKSSGNYDEFFFQRQYYVDVKHVINEVILFKAGQNAALRGLNIAFPYMDNDVASFIAGLPRNLRFEGEYMDIIKGRGKSKITHRKLYSSAMPDELSKKKKQGGFAPLPLFFQSAANLDLAEKVILQSGLANSQLNMNWIKEFIRRYRIESQKTPNWFWYSQLQAFKLFNLLVLAVWWETVLNGSSAKRLSDLIK